LYTNEDERAWKIMESLLSRKRRVTLPAVYLDFPLEDASERENSQ